MSEVTLKTDLLLHCQNQVDLRYGKIKQAIADIEESMLEEAKSSSGDKHETGRAMLQIDRENAGKQLREIEKVVQIVKKIDINTITEYAHLGSLVYTTGFTYFLSISIGELLINKNQYLCVALNSPVGMLLSGKKKDDSFTFNGKEYTITAIK